MVKDPNQGADEFKGWAKGLNYRKIVLETGKQQQKSVSLYQNMDLLKLNISLPTLRSPKVSAWQNKSNLHEKKPGLNRVLFSYLRLQSLKLLLF